METNTNVSLQSIYHLNKYQRNLIVNQIYAALAIVKSADNSLMSQKFEIILKTVYSDRIGRRIAEINIRNFANFQRGT
jgi:hypothetical protein